MIFRSCSLSIRSTLINNPFKSRIATVTSRSIMTSSQSSSTSPPLLIDPISLSNLIKNPINKSPPTILDATWFMPNDPKARKGQDEYHKRRIGNALFWNVDQIATTGDSVRNLPHMMPTPEVFAKAAASHGISRDTHVVVYDSHGVFSSPRTAFTFLAFSHAHVSILNGGLPAWIDAGLPIEEGPSTSKVETVDYPNPSLGDGLIRSWPEMRANAGMGPRGQTVLDARPSGRFDGTVPEPRAGMSSGHIPNSLSLPFPNLVKQVQSKDPRLNGETYTILKDQTELWRTVSDAVGGMESLDKLRQASSAAEPAVTATCGSGMTAAVIWAALQQLGVTSAIYDESWMGWAGREESPIEKTEG